MTKKGCGCLTVLGIFLAVIAIAAIIALAPEEKSKPPVEPTQPKYTTRQVYDFVCNYEIHPGGYTVDKMTDMLCLVMKAQGDKVNVTDGKAYSWRGEDIWKVSYVVVINDSEFHTFEYEVNMLTKTVKPLSKSARDLWQTK